MMTRLKLQRINLLKLPTCSPKMEAFMEAAVAKEKQATSQHRGRDASLKLSLLSELKITSPVAFMVRRALYRLESAMGSISNRIYALLATVVILLVLSAGIFIAGTLLDDNEWSSLRADAGVHDNTAHGFRTTVLYALWLTWCFFVDPGSHTQKLDHIRCVNGSHFPNGAYIHMIV
jgi:hypothetical protein